MVYKSTGCSKLTKDVCNKRITDCYWEVGKGCKAILHHVHQDKIDNQESFNSSNALTVCRKPLHEYIEHKFNNLSVDDIIDFHELVQSESYTTDKTFSLMMHVPKILMSYWTVFALTSRYSLIDQKNYDPHLKGSSANGKFCILNCSNDMGKLEKLFIKFQIMDNADNMMIDSVNGFMINQFRANGSCGDNFMTYRDSFATFVEEKDDAHGRKQFYFDMFSIIQNSDQMLSKQSQYIYNKIQISSPLPIASIPFYDSSIQYKLATNINLKKVSFHKLIQGDSLQNIIENDANYKNNPAKLFPMLSRLFHSIAELGHVCGFVHNDAHLYNVMLSYDSNNLVLIDYGRVYFSPFVMPKRMYEKMSNRIIIEKLKNDAAFYRNITSPIMLRQKINIAKREQYYSQTYYTWLCELYNGVPNYIHPFLVQTSDFVHQEIKEFFDKTMFMFDISTITLNIIKTYTKFGEKRFNKFVFMDNGYITLNYQNLDDFNKMELKNAQDPFEYIIVPGLYWLYLYVMHLHSSVGLNHLFIIDPITKDVTIDFDQCASDRYKLFWWSFQFRYLPGAVQFAQRIYLHKLDVVRMLSKIDELGKKVTEAVIGGRQVHKKNKSKSTMNYDPDALDADGKPLKVPRSIVDIKPSIKFKNVPVILESDMTALRKIKSPFDTPVSSTSKNTKQKS